jgi:hypothetical protein
MVLIPLIWKIYMSFRTTDRSEQSYGQQGVKISHPRKTGLRNDENMKLKNNPRKSALSASFAF